MTINLNATSDFTKGDTGRTSGHRVTKVDASDNKEKDLVIALQDVKAGTNGWFDNDPKGK